MDNTDYIINGILNEDGTEFNPPKNYLREKWEKENPPMRHGVACSPIFGYQENGRPYMNYTCVLCTEERCIHSSNFKVPEEDKEEYEKYLKSYKEYIDIHNPNFLDNINKKLATMVADEQDMIESLSKGD